MKECFCDCDFNCPARIQHRHVVAFVIWKEREPFTPTIFGIESTIVRALVMATEHDRANLPGLDLRIQGRTVGGRCGHDSGWPERRRTRCRRARAGHAAMARSRALSTASGCVASRSAGACAPSQPLGEVSQSRRVSTSHLSATRAAISDITGKTEPALSNWNL